MLGGSRRVDDKPGRWARNPANQIPYEREKVVKVVEEAVNLGN
jgi:hypothetical protein